MPRSTLILAASLVANLTLVFALARRPGVSSEGTSTIGTSVEAGTVKPASSLRAARTSVKPDQRAGGSAPSGGNLWSQLYAADLDQFAARLRAAGFPAHAVRMMVVEASLLKTEAARASIVGPRENVPYWREPARVPDDPKLRVKLTEISLEESDVLMKNLFSREALLEEEEVSGVARRQFGDLPVEKLVDLWKIEGDYHELRRAIYRPLALEQKRELTTADREKLAFLEAEKRRDIERLLTPEEFAQFELRSSPTASRLRSQLETFRPSETEYQALFALHRQVDVQLGAGDDTDATKRARTAALEALKPQLEAALGPERYADYVQATERGNEKLNRLMVRLELPLATVGKIEAVQKDITQRAESIRGDRQLTAVERDARLAGLAHEARTTLTGTLGGQRGYGAYEDMRGDWIRALQPKPATP